MHAETELKIKQMDDMPAALPVAKPSQVIVRIAETDPAVWAILKLQREIDED